MSPDDTSPVGGAAAAPGTRPAGTGGVTRIAFLEFAPGVSRRNGWTYLYASLVSIMLVAFANFAQPYVLREIAHVPEAEIGRVMGFLTTVPELVQLALVALIGSLADRYGRRGLFAAAALATGIGYAGFGYAGNLAELFAWRALLALGFAGINVILAVLIADYPTERARGRLAGAGGLLNGVGVTFGVLAAAQLPRLFVAGGADAASAGRYMLLCVAALSLATAVVLQVGLKRGTPATHHQKISALSAFRIGLQHGRDNPRLMLAYVGTFMSRADVTIAATFISLWLQEAARHAGMSGAEAIARASMLFGIIQVSSLLWAPVAGLLIDRFDRVACVAGALGAGTAGYLLLGLQDDPFRAGGIAACVLCGIGQMSVLLAVQSLVGQEAPVQVRGSVIGLSSFFGAVGILSTNFAGGYLYDHVALAAPVLLVGALNLAGLVYAVRVWVGDGRPVRFSARAATSDS